MQTDRQDRLIDRYAAAADGCPYDATVPSAEQTPYDHYEPDDAQAEFGTDESSPDPEIRQVALNLQQLEEQILKSSEQLRLWQRQIEHYANGLIRKEAELSKRTEQLEELQRKLQETEHQIQQRRHEVEQLQQELQQREEKLQTEQAALAAEREQIERLRAEAEQRQQELDRQRQEIESQKAELEQTRQDLQSQAAEIQAQREELSRQAEQLEADRKAFEEHSVQIQQQRDELNRQREELEKKARALKQWEEQLAERAEVIDRFSAAVCEAWAGLSSIISEQSGRDFSQMYPQTRQVGCDCPPDPHGQPQTSADAIIEDGVPADGQIQPDTQPPQVAPADQQYWQGGETIANCAEDEPACWPADAPAYHETDHIYPYDQQADLDEQQYTARDRHDESEDAAAGGASQATRSKHLPTSLDEVDESVRRQVRMLKRLGSDKSDAELIALVLRRRDCDSRAQSGTNKRKWWPI